MTLSDERVKATIEEGWVSTWHNQCPGLYCDKTADLRKPIPYPPEQLATIYEGTGGGNIRIYFCDPDGGVIHFVSGFLDSSRLYVEEEFARQQMGRREDLRRNLCEDRATAQAGCADELVRPEIRDHRARNLLAVPHGRDVWRLLRAIEDDIYLKGAIG